MKTIHHVVDMGALATTVSEALTTIEGLAGWWTTRVGGAASKVGDVIDFTFVEGFNPDMEVTAAADNVIGWRCVGGHEPWADNTFRFTIATLDDGRTRLRFWQHYAVELDDDYYGTYNFNWGYHLESLRLLCVEGTGKPFDAR